MIRFISWLICVRKRILRHSRLQSLLGAAFICALAGCKLIDEVEPEIVTTGTAVVPASVPYVDVSTLSKPLHLKGTWIEPGKKFRLVNQNFSLQLEVGSFRASINGVTIWLGQRTILKSGAVHLSMSDCERLLKPILTAGRDNDVISPIRTIVIDPGHGGMYPGMQSQSPLLDEKTLTLDVSLHLKTLLEKAHYRVLLTRTSDVELDFDKPKDLDKRLDIAAAAAADLFVSIHFNAGPESAQGTETWILAPPEQISRLITDPTKDEKLHDLFSGNQFDRWNAVLGYAMQRHFTQELKQADRGLKYSRLYVLRQIHCPAVLIESAFLSNPLEAQKLMTADFRENIAQTIFGGIVEYDETIKQLARKP